MKESENFAENIFIGPRSFETGERLFGRDDEIRALTQQLTERRVVLLFSPSGAGKTSLVRAGLIPAMQAERFQVLPIVRINHSLHNR